MLDDLEVSEENNACSIFVDVDVDGRARKVAVAVQERDAQPSTEIEPFGGASTCLGGAIRDPLSGRSYVYQAMRVTGAAIIYQPVGETLAGKLPQRVISRKAAAVIRATATRSVWPRPTCAKSIIPTTSPSALEVGAVVGAVKAETSRAKRLPRAT